MKPGAQERGGGLCQITSTRTTPANGMVNGHGEAGAAEPGTGLAEEARRGPKKPGKP